MENAFFLALALIAASLVAALLQSCWSKDKPQAKSSTPGPKKQRSGVRVAEEAKAKEGHKQAWLPPGQIVYCKFCKIFLETEEFVNIHPSGKKHKRAAGKDQTQWYALLRAEDKDTFDPASLNPPEPVVVEEPSEEEEEPLEPGWTR